LCSANSLSPAPRRNHNPKKSHKQKRKHHLLAELGKYGLGVHGPDEEYDDGNAALEDDSVEVDKGEPGGEASLALPPIRSKLTRSSWISMRAISECNVLSRRSKRSAVVAADDESLGDRRVAVGVGIGRDVAVTAVRRPGEAPDSVLLSSSNTVVGCWLGRRKKESNKKSLSDRLGERGE
jgi:hypothetical protein